MVKGTLSVPAGDCTFPRLTQTTQKPLQATKSPCLALRAFPFPTKSALHPPWVPENVQGREGRALSQRDKAEHENVKPDWGWRQRGARGPPRSALPSATVAGVLPCTQGPQPQGSQPKPTDSLRLERQAGREQNPHQRQEPDPPIAKLEGNPES